MRPWLGSPTSYASGYISAQWTATSSHSLTWEFSSPPTYWIGLETWARRGSRRGERGRPPQNGPGEPPGRPPPPPPHQASNGKGAGGPPPPAAPPPMSN